MKGWELKEIIHSIKSDTGESVTSIAGNLGISQAHLSTVAKKDGENDISANIVIALKKNYPTYFENMQGNKPIRVESSPLAPVQLQATLSALLHHYAEFVHRQGGPVPGKTVQDVLDAAMKDLVSRSNS